MKFTIYQYAIAAISLWFIATSFVRFIRRETTQSVIKFLTYLFIWSTVLMIGVFPSAARALASNLGLGQDLGMAIFLGFIVIFIILFKLLSIIERTERTVTEIIRKQALDEISRERKPRHG